MVVVVAAVAGFAVLWTVVGGTYGSGVVVIATAAGGGAVAVATVLMIGRTTVTNYLHQWVADVAVARPVALQCAHIQYTHNTS